jgi:hypothetical protein
VQLDQSHIKTTDDMLASLVNGFYKYQQVSTLRHSSCNPPLDPYFINTVYSFAPSYPSQCLPLSLLEAQASSPSISSSCSLSEAIAFMLQSAIWRTKRNANHSSPCNRLTPEDYTSSRQIYSKKGYSLKPCRVVMLSIMSPHPFSSLSKSRME